MLKKSFTFSFSKRNLDVYNIVNDYSEDEYFNIPDYFCEAIRFYESNKDIIENLKNNQVNKEKIKSLLLDLILSNDSVKSAIRGVSSTSFIPATQIQNQIEDKKSSNLIELDSSKPNISKKDLVDD